MIQHINWLAVTYCYTDSLQSLNTGKRATFTILGNGPSDLLGKPKFVELGYDWQWCFVLRNETAFWSKISCGNHRNEL